MLESSATLETVSIRSPASIAMGALLMRARSKKRSRHLMGASWLRLSLLKTRFVRIDGVARQGSDAQQCLRTARSGVCKQLTAPLMIGDHFFLGFIPSTGGRDLTYVAMAIRSSAESCAVLRTTSAMVEPTESPSGVRPVSSK